MFVDPGLSTTYPSAREGMFIDTATTPTIYKPDALVGERVIIVEWQRLNRLEPGSPNTD